MSNACANAMYDCPRVVDWRPALQAHSLARKETLPAAGAAAERVATYVPCCCINELASRGRPPHWLQVLPELTDGRGGVLISGGSAQDPPKSAQDTLDGVDCVECVVCASVVRLFARPRPTIKLEWSSALNGVKSMLRCRSVAADQPTTPLSGRPALFAASSPLGNGIAVKVPCSDNSRPDWADEVLSFFVSVALACWRTARSLRAGILLAHAPEPRIRLEPIDAGLGSAMAALLW